MFLEVALVHKVVVCAFPKAILEALVASAKHLRYAVLCRLAICYGAYVIIIF